MIDIHSKYSIMFCIGKKCIAERQTNDQSYAYISFAIGAGAFHADKKDRGAGGLGGKMIPSAVLVIQNGTTRLVNIKNQDTMTKILDMVPDVIDRFKSPSEDKMTEEDVADLLNEADSPENQE